MLEIRSEQRGQAAVARLQGSKHRFYEDRYRILTREAPFVHRQRRGEIFAVFDGISSEKGGRSAAQLMSDRLLLFYKEPEKYSPSAESLKQILLEANNTIYSWGSLPGSSINKGGCAGTVVWIHGNRLFSFHAGDTVALLLRDKKGEQFTDLHELDNALYRFFGLGPKLELDIKRMELKEFDIILMVTDGVTKVIHPREAGSSVTAMLEEYGDPTRAARRLVETARSRGSTDDITVLLIEMDEFWYPDQE
uniref:Protein serine/threonine phosphatase 2C family protein n=1 Tax=Desulfobacca acetoxidans TaxID=60893 RepID=A0A7V4G7N1_9BACT